MSGDWLFLDSNIILYLLAGDAELVDIFIESNPKISFMVELEILSAPNLSDADRSQIHRLLGRVNVLNYTNGIRDIVIKIRAQKRLKLPDSIIAATAIYYNSPLITADKAFQSVEGLDLIYYEPKFK